jgi:predicted amidophosphoribosyltransferase
MINMSEEERHFGTCKECKHYVPVDKNDLCAVCTRPLNTGERQAEWRLSKIGKKAEDD